MKEEVVKVKEYLTFIIKTGRKGTAITCIFDEQIIGKKRACDHARCNVLFIAEMTLVAEQMRNFERVFEQVENLN
jgi:hypothetical protein